MNDAIKKYPFLKRRSTVWKEIVRYVSHDTGPVETLLELGAGYCDFINHFPANQKICYDINPEMRQFASSNIQFHNKNAIDLEGLSDKCVDLIFASNFLEHLSQNQLENLFFRINTVLEDNGTLVLIQPNFNLCKDRYFIDETHVSIFSDSNIIEFLDSFGFITQKLIPNFLPLTMNSKLPKFSFLVRLYLHSFIRPYAGQMYILAKKKD